MERDQSGVTVGGLYPAVLLPKGTVALLIISALCCWSSGCDELSSVHIKRPSSATLNGLEGPAASYQGPNSCFHIPLSPGAVGGGGSSLVLSYQSTAEENPITGMDIIISLIPVVKLKTGSPGQQIQTMVPFSNSTDEGMTGTDK